MVTAIPESSEVRLAFPDRREFEFSDGVLGVASAAGWKFFATFDASGYVVQKTIHHPHHKPLEALSEREVALVRGLMRYFSGIRANSGKIAAERAEPVI